MVLLILAVIGIGAYAYVTNPIACGKLGTDIAADTQAIFMKPPSDDDDGVTGSVPSSSRHFQPGFITDQPSTTSGPSAAPNLNAPTNQPESHRSLPRSFSRCVGTAPA